MTGSRVAMPIKLPVILYSCVHCVDGTIFSRTRLPSQASQLRRQLNNIIV